MTTGVEYALWGLFGGFAVEGLEFAAAIRKTGQWPWRLEDEPTFAMFMCSVVIRLAVGAGLAAAAGIAHQVNGPFGALAVGVAAPLVVEQLADAALVTPQGRSPAAESEGEGQGANRQLP